MLNLKKEKILLSELRSIEFFIETIPSVKNTKAKIAKRISITFSHNLLLYKAKWQTKSLPFRNILKI